MANYRHLLKIGTGTVSGAGTDETVKLFFSVDGIVIAGTISITGDRGRFENGDVNEFYVDSPRSFHAADHVSLRITNTGTNAADWYCYGLSIAGDGWSKSFRVRDWIRAGENYKSYEQYIGFGPAENVAKFESVAEGTKLADLIGNEKRPSKKKSEPKKKARR